MRYAALLQRENKVMIHPWARSISGVMFGIEPYLVIEGQDPNTLGSAIRRVLAASKSGEPHPDPRDSSKRLQPLLKVAGVRSWSALVRGARSVEIADDGREVVFTPTQNCGAKGGFVELVELEITVSQGVRDSALGASALKALQLCTDA